MKKRISEKKRAEKRALADRREVSRMTNVGNGWAWAVKFCR